MVLAAMRSQMPSSNNFINKMNHMMGCNEDPAETECAPLAARPKSTSWVNGTFIINEAENCQQYKVLK